MRTLNSIKRRMRAVSLIKRRMRALGPFKTAALGVGVAVAACLPQPARAHPHVWVYTDVQVNVVQHQGRAHTNQLQVHWEFDELYSASFLLEMDTNANKTLEPAELAPIKKNVFEDGQADLFPFMLMQFGGKKVPFNLKNPEIWMDEKDILHYRFDLVFQTPQPLAGEPKIAFYDPEFYVSFEQNYDLGLPAGAPCTAELKPDKTISIYMDLVNPEVYHLNCTGQQALRARPATLSKTAKLNEKVTV